MDHFPVTSSNLSASQLATLLQETYNLGKATTCRIIKAGVNHTYQVKDGTDQYVFRIYSLNWRTKNEILEEIRLINLLKEHQISVSYPLTDSKGNYIQEINAPEGLRFGVLFSFANGEKVFSYSTETHYAIGQMMGKIHQITQDLRLERTTYTPQILLVDPFEQLRPFLPADSEEMKFMVSAQHALLKTLLQVQPDQLRQGVVHLDIWFDNLNIDHDQQVTLFDFDFCGNGWLCLDIAYYILQVYSTEKDDIERKTKVEQFLKGYESVVAISDEEKQLIPALGVSLYFFYLGVQCQRYDNWSNVFLNEAHLKRYINLLVKKYFDAHNLGQTNAS